MRLSWTKPQLPRRRCRFVTPPFQIGKRFLSQIIVTRKQSPSFKHARNHSALRSRSAITRVFNSTTRFSAHSFSIPPPMARFTITPNSLRECMTRVRLLSSQRIYKRHMPGRLVGVSHDAEGRPAYRLALQTREQHIRRDKATSNICTAQVLLAVIASMYAVYHGPKGLRTIAERVHRLTSQLADGLQALGCTFAHKNFFDTIRVEVESSEVILEHAAKAGCNLRSLGPRAVGISFDETTTPRDIELLMAVFRGTTVRDLADDNLGEPPLRIPQFAIRTSDFLTHPIFNTHDTETEMLRYLKKLESHDLSLTTSMIPLGSCTMKLNATAEMFPISWPEISKLHPLAPIEQAAGYLEI